ncbi:uncharacterized protein DS421_12g363330 [Arachis hypogaea]|nr:uncharacterized protein DS421_12g363330 [Arachis hypogaea]
MKGLHREAGNDAAACVEAQSEEWCRLDRRMRLQRGAMATCNRGGGAWATERSKSRWLLSDGPATLTTIDGGDRRRLHEEEVARR